jgi:probable rRNA maturation factor
MNVSEERVRQIIEGVLRAEGVVRTELVVALVDDPTIHRVNREHLDHDYPTDVISFLYDRQPAEPVPDAPSVGKARSGSLDASTPRGFGVSLEGELVVSTETALREAAQFGWNPLDELTLYLVHGTLHLCGYDDQTDEEIAEMRHREKSILKIWDLTPHYG